MTKLFRWFTNRFKYKLNLWATAKEEIAAAFSQNHTVIFVLRRPSFVESRILNIFLHKNGFPKPKIIDLTQDKARSLPEGCYILHLRDRPGHEFSLLRTRIRRKKLKLFLKQAKPTTLFVPTAFFAGLGPRPLPAPLDLPLDFSFFPLPDIWLIFVYLAHRDFLLLEIGPVLRIDLLKPSSKILHSLSKELYWKEKSIRGSKQHKLGEIETMVLSGEQFEKSLEATAITTASSSELVFQQAQKIFGEIAAKINGPIINFLRLLISPIISKIFTDIKITGLNDFRNCSQRHPVVLLPTHRSHFDYLIISYLLYYANLPLPFIAAGANLNFFPVGPLVRAGGAFFIRRKIENDVLYKTILERYLTYLIKQGQMIEFFIEGGRSRSGYILQPRLGLLKSLVRSFSRGERSDLMFVPISITYEDVPEAKDFYREELGHKKTKENIFKLLKGAFRLRQNFGSVVVNFGKPLSLRDFSNLPDSKILLPDNTIPALTEDLAFSIIRALQTNSSLTNSAILSAAILSCPSPEVSAEEVAQKVFSILHVIALVIGETEAANNHGSLQACLKNIVDEKLFHQISVTTTFKETFATNPISKGIENSLDNMVLAEKLEKKERDGKTYYCYSDEQGIKLTYYANQIAHFLVTPLIVSAATLCTGNPNFEYGMRILYEIFRLPFLLPLWSNWKAQAYIVLENMEGLGWIPKASGSRVPLKGSTDNLANTSPHLMGIMRLLIPYLSTICEALALVKTVNLAEIKETAFTSLLKDRLYNNPLLPPQSRLLSLINFSTKYVIKTKQLEQTINSQKPSDRIFRTPAIYDKNLEANLRNLISTIKDGDAPQNS